MSFTGLLIHTCDIQVKSLTLQGYEKIPVWTTAFSSVACRHDMSNSTQNRDSNIHESTDDDIFFFSPTVQIFRGNRIIHDGSTYEVVRVAKIYAASCFHHLEVIGRVTDNK